MAGYGPSVESLGELSFSLHKDLAERNGGREKWGYSLTSGNSYTEAPPSKRGKKGHDWLMEEGSRAEVAASHNFRDGKGPAWLTRRRGDNIDIISEDATCAQVDPLRLSQFFLEECQSQGVRLHQPAKVVSIIKDEGGGLKGVRIRKNDSSESDISCTHLLVTAGAWTPRVFKTLFPESTIKIPISQLAGHSIVIKSPRWSAEHEDKGCHAVFSSSSCGFSPEMFSRIGGEVYVAGLNDSSIPLPELATDAKIDRKSMDQLLEVCEKMLGLDHAKSDLEVTREGLCFRPVTPKGTPILSRVSGERLGIKTSKDGQGGVFTAVGHGPWGISLAPGTGKVMAEMIQGQRTSARIDGLAL